MNRGKKKNTDIGRQSWLKSEIKDKDESRVAKVAKKEYSARFSGQASATKGVGRTNQT